MPISLAAFNEYVNQLSNHDWYFEFSDDHRAYNQGNERHKMLVTKAKTHPIYQEAFSAYNVFGTSTDSGALIGRISRRDVIIDGLRTQIIELRKITA